MTEPTATFAPVTQERIAATLEALDLKYFRDEEKGDIRTAFPGLAIFFEVGEPGFKATARWMTIFNDPGEIAKLRVKANDMNRSLPLLRVHAITRNDNTAVAVMEAPFFARAGVTDTQLRQMIEFFFSIIHHCRDELKRTFPNAQDIEPTDDGTATTEEA